MLYIAPELSMDPCSTCGREKTLFVRCYKASIVKSQINGPCWKDVKSRALVPMALSIPSILSSKLPQNLPKTFVTCGLVIPKQTELQGSLVFKIMMVIKYS